MAHDEQPKIIDNPTDLPSAPMSSLLGFDTPCFSCDYNLRGLGLDANCPECNKPIIESVSSQLLRHADPEYVIRLYKGARMIRNASLMPIIGMFLSFLLAIYLRASGSSIPDALVYGYIVIMLAFFLFGWIRLTTLETATLPGSDSDTEQQWRRRIPVALTALFALGIILAGFYFGNPTKSALVSMLAVAQVMVITHVVHIHFATRHVKNLALRFPSKKLSAYASKTYKVTLIAAALVSAAIAFEVWNVFAPPPPPPSSSIPTLSGSLSAFVFEILPFLFGLGAYSMYVSLFNRLRSHLSKTCKLNPVVAA